jgi:GNAT superfamily N-acetyltransferase
MKVRFAEQADREALIALALENRHEIAHAPVAVCMERVEQTLHGLFERNPGSHVVLLVQTDAGDLVGLLIGCVERYFYSDALQAQLIQWYVKKSYRGTSAAPRLVKAFVAWARSRGANDVFMGISSGLNVHLTHRLMMRLGFAYLGGNYGIQLKTPAEVPHAG